MPEPIENYKLLKKPMDFGLFFELKQALDDHAEEEEPGVSEEFQIPQWMITVIRECRRRFPEDESVIHALRFIHRMLAMVAANKTGMLDDWWEGSGESEEFLNGAAVFAAAVCPLRPDGTFEPKQYMRYIARCHKIIQRELSRPLRRTKRRKRSG